jgi:hypothetical protein
MSLFLADAPDPATVVRDILLAITGAAPPESFEYLPGDVVATAAIANLWVAAAKEKPPADKWLKDDLLGFLPRVNVHLTLDKEATGLAKLRALEVTAAVFATTRGDAALTWQTDSIIVRRRDGKVELAPEVEERHGAEFCERARTLLGIRR